MFQNNENASGHKPMMHSGHKSHGISPIGGKLSGDRTPTYSKVFRWNPPAGQTEMPALVEIVGTFTHWERVPLQHDRNTNAWQVTMHNIPSHKTHHYMLLADGKPVQDKNSDGLAIAHGKQEEQFALSTPRGPRVFMLFAQSK